MKLKCIVLFIVLLSGSAAYAQRGQLEYAIGLRAGLGSGVTLQYFHTDDFVFEGIIYTRLNTIGMNALFEMHQQLLDIRGVKWYFGAGLHGGTLTGQTAFILDENGNQQSGFLAGADAIIGLEYFSRSFPLQVSIDWKPEYQMTPFKAFNFGYGGLSVRYRL